MSIAVGASLSSLAGASQNGVDWRQHQAYHPASSLRTLRGRATVSRSGSTPFLKGAARSCSNACKKDRRDNGHLTSHQWFLGGADYVGDWPRDMSSGRGGLE